MLLVLAAGLLAASPAGAAFRCGNDLVQEGDREYDVLGKCGEPDFRESHAGAYLQGVGPVNTTETWYYNPGPTRLVRILTFHHGRLRSIETGERGLDPDIREGACQPLELYTGMSRYELLSRCGEPAARESWFANDGSILHRQHRLRGTVLVEEWTYTFGSNRFRRHVRIIGGRVVDIQTGDKGG